MVGRMTWLPDSWSGLLFRCSVRRERFLRRRDRCFRCLGKMWGEPPDGIRLCGHCYDRHDMTPEQFARRQEGRWWRGRQNSSTSRNERAKSLQNSCRSATSTRTVLALETGGKETA